MLPYTADSYFAQIAQYHQAIWPVQLLILALVLTCMSLTLMQTVHASRLVSAILAGAWIWTGAIFHDVFFAELNFAAPIYAGLFVAQGLLLAWAGVVRAQIQLQYELKPLAWAGLLLLIIAMVAYPVADLGSGRLWQQLRLPGLTPTPTAIFTCGILLMTRRPLLRFQVLPVVWLVVAAGTGWVLAIIPDQVFPLLAILILAWVPLYSRRVR